MSSDFDAENLLQRAKGGDQAALEELLRTVQPQLYRFSMKMCRHTEDAEDVLQDSLMSLARSFKDFRGASSFSTWLFAVARSFCIKKRRKSKFAPPHEESLDQLTEEQRDQIPSKEPSPHDTAESHELWRQVKDAIAKIQPDYREILVLRDIEGLSAKEVAAIVELSVPAVKSRLHRARSMLRDELAASPYRPPSGCPDIRRVFSEHLEGDLSPSICASMESHVENCPACATECSGLRDVLNACSTAPCEVPPEVQRRVQRALKEALEVQKT